MSDTYFNTNKCGDLQSDVEAMYQVFTVANHLQNASQQILDMASRLTGAEKSSLMMLNGRGELYVLNARGQDGINLKASHMKIGEGIAGKVAVDGIPLLVEDISADTRFSDFKRERYRTGSFIACPVTSREKIIGVLNLNDKDSGETFSVEDLAHAKFISTVVETKMDNFLDNARVSMEKSEIKNVFYRLVEAECNSCEFVFRISDDLLAPLRHIRDAVNILNDSSLSDTAMALDQHQTIEKEVTSLISYIVEKVQGYEKVKAWLNDIDESEAYSKLLE